MSWVTGGAIYFILWWVTLFAVLPFGVRTQDEESDIVPGTVASAPAGFRFWRVMGTTTIVAAVIFLAGILCLAISASAFPICRTSCLIFAEPRYSLSPDIR